MASLFHFQLMKLSVSLIEETISIKLITKLSFPSHVHLFKYNSAMKQVHEFIILTEEGGLYMWNSIDDNQFDFIII